MQRFNIHHKRNSIGSAVLLMIGLISGQVSANSVIEVITNDQYPVTGIEPFEQNGMDVKVYNLDAPKRVLAKFKQGLVPENGLAINKAAIKKRLDAMGREPLRRMFMTAYQGIIKATRYQVNRYPVVLFENGTLAVYGITHLPDAWRWYQAHQEGR